MLRCVTCFPHKLNHLLAGILASISVKGGRLWVTTATWVKLMLSAGLEPGLELVIMAITLGVVSPSHWTFLFGLFHVSFHLAKWLIVCFTLLKCGINYIFANLCCRLTNRCARKRIYELSEICLIQKTSKLINPIAANYVSVFPLSWTSFATETHPTSWA